MSESLKGRVVSEETRRKMSENHADVSGANNPRARRVGQYGKDGALIKEWECIKDAQTALKCHHISSCCNGKRKSSGGFAWAYID